MTPVDTILDIVSDDQKCIETLFKVVPKDSSGGVVPFILRPAQVKMAEAARQHNRIIIIKPRQVGSTTFWGAALLRRSMYVAYASSVIVAHESEITERLLKRTDIFYNQLPEEMKVPLEGDSTKYKKFVTGGTIFMGTARASVFGRGDTIHNFLASEVSFWREEHILNVLLPAIEAVPMLNGLVVLESTPNGDTGYFYEQVQGALRGENNWHLVVIYWWDDPDYRIPEGHSILEGKPYQYDFEYTPEEHALVFKHDLDKEQIRWRRYKIGDLGDLFFQEYIESLETCFLTGGSPYYDPGNTLALNRKCYPAPHTYGLTKVWEEPQPGGKYILGVDPGQAKQTESVACMVRIDEGRYVSALVHGVQTQIFVPQPRQVALLGAFLEPSQFAPLCMELGRRYDAVMNPECNSHGIAFIDAIRGRYNKIHLRRDVERGAVIMRYGWQSNTRTKRYMMDEIQRTLEYSIIPDEETVKQIRSFRHDPEKPPDGYFTNDFDDRHDAWGLALVAMGPIGKADRGYKGSSGHTSWDSSRRK